MSVAMPPSSFNRFSLMLCCALVAVDCGAETGTETLPDSIADATRELRDFGTIDGAGDLGAADSSSDVEPPRDLTDSPPDIPIADSDDAGGCPDASVCSPSCSGTQLNGCDVDESGCPVPTATDCASLATGGYCDASTPPPRCIDPGDPCVELDECGALNVACDGDDLRTCAVSASGCLELEIEDCTMRADGRCSSDLDPPQCVVDAGDPCVGLTLCDPADPDGRCEDGEVVSCITDGFGCRVEGRSVCGVDTSCQSTAGSAACVVDTPDPVGTCDDPIVLTGSGSYSGNTSDSDRDFDDYNGDCGVNRTGAGRDQVMRIAVPGRSEIDVLMDGVGGWDEVVVLASTCTNPISTCLALGDDPGSASWFNASADPVDIYVIADGYSVSAAGNYTLDVTISTAVCGDGVVDFEGECDDENDVTTDGCDACVIQPGFICTGEPSVCVAGDGTCDFPYALAGPGSFVFSTDGMTLDYDDYDGDCGTNRRGAGPDAVLSITVPSRIGMDILMDGIGGWDEVVAIAADCVDPMTTCLDFGDDPGAASWFNNSADPVEVFIVADGYSSAADGEFSLDISFTETVCGDGEVDYPGECDDLNDDESDGCHECIVTDGWRCLDADRCVEGEGTCESPLIVGEGSWEFNNANAPSLYDDYQGLCDSGRGQGPELVFAVDVPNLHLADISMTASWDEALIISSSCVDPVDTCLDYSDPGNVGHYNNIGDVDRIYVFADGWYSYSNGDFQLDVDFVSIECGDGVVDPYEPCDDGPGDPSDGDGCSENCGVEAGWHCLGEPSECDIGEGTCESPIPLDAGEYQLDSTGYTNDHFAYDGVCSGSGRGDGPDVVTSVIVPANTILDVDMDGTSWDEVLAVVTDCAASSDSCIIYSDPGSGGWVNDSSESHEVYVIADGYYSYSDGPFDLVISLSTYQLDQWADVCSDAMLVSPGLYFGDTTGATGAYDDYDGVCGTNRSGAGPEHVYAVEIPAGYRLDANLEAAGSTWDWVLVVSTDCDDIVGSCVNWSDPGSVSRSNNTGSPVTAYVIVDGYFGSSDGAYYLDIDVVLD